MRDWFCRRSAFDRGVENEDLVAIHHPEHPRPSEHCERPACPAGRLRARRDRVRELVGRYGAPTIQEVMARCWTPSNRASRRPCRPSRRRGEAVGFLDDDGRWTARLSVRVVVQKRADRLAIDLSGPDPQIAGAMNVPWASARAGIVYAVRAGVVPDSPRMTACCGPSTSSRRWARPEPRFARGRLHPPQHLSAFRRHADSGDERPLAGEGRGQQHRAPSSASTSAARHR